MCVIFLFVVRFSVFINGILIVVICFVFFGEGWLKESFLVMNSLVGERRFVVKGFMIFSDFYLCVVMLSFFWSLCFVVFKGFCFFLIFLLMIFRVNLFMV